MEFLCPVAAGDVWTWQHLAHLGLLGVVLGTGVPMVAIAVVRYRATARPAPVPSVRSAVQRPLVTRVRRRPEG